MFVYEAIRCLAKTVYEGLKFRETSTQHEVSAEKMKVIDDARAVADEWVTPMRLTHVLGDLGLNETVDVTKTGDIIRGMIADIEKEAVGEVVFSDDVRKQIGKKTASIFKEYLNAQIKEE